ncbi:MAG: VWA domain-containing protein, partial [Tannerella sp.]|nr:VWA domain-containing protein [Tannerella sp.]
IEIDKKKIESNAVSIEVLVSDDGEEDKKTAQKSNSNGVENSVSAADDIKENDLFLRAIVSDPDIYEQEGFLVTFKLYTAHDLASINEVKIPDFEGFAMCDTEQSDASWKVERDNGRNYNTVVIKKVVLYPQRSGKIQIDNASVEAIVRVRAKSQSRKFFDDFFDDGSNNLVKKIHSLPVTVNVKPLPTGKPDLYNGLVGQDYKIESTISSGNANVGDTLLYKVIVNGSGNTKWINLPAVDFPAEFDLLETTVFFETDEKDAIKGTKTYLYKCIPKKEGDLEISGIQLSYFDLKTHTYKSIYSESLPVFAGPGTITASGKDHGLVKQNEREEHTQSDAAPENHFSVKKTDLRMILWILCSVALVLCVFALLLLNNAVVRGISLFFSLVILSICFFLFYSGKKGKSPESFLTTGDKMPERKEKTDIVIVLDISGSMLAEDLKPNRLEVAKNAVNTLTRSSKANIGLVLFAGESYTELPVTSDMLSVRDHIGSAGAVMTTDQVRDGTAIGAGIMNAVNNLKDRPGGHKMIVLLTDGRNNMGDIAPATASEIAGMFGIGIYAIGLGTKGKAPYPVQTAFGVQYKDVIVDIDEETLRKITSMTGGEYFRAASNDDLEQIIHTVNQQITEYRESDIPGKQTYDYINKEYASSLLDAFLTEDKNIQKRVRNNGYKEL